VPGTTLFLRTDLLRSARKNRQVLESGAGPQHSKVC
jgi:hypothetical protein